MKGDNLPNPFDPNFHHAMDHPHHPGDKRPSSARLMIHLIRQHGVTYDNDLLFASREEMDVWHRSLDPHG